MQPLNILWWLAIRRLIKNYAKWQQLGKGLRANVYYKNWNPKTLVESQEKIRATLP